VKRSKTMPQTAVRRPAPEELARIEYEARRLRAAYLARAFRAVRRKLAVLAARDGRAARA
jgi:hypothetical protein